MSGGPEGHGEEGLGGVPDPIPGPSNGATRRQETGRAGRWPDTPRRACAGLALRGIQVPLWGDSRLPQAPAPASQPLLTLLQAVQV